VVFWAGADDAGAAVPFLSIDEKRRAARYRSTEARSEFVAGAFMVRSAAAGILGVPIEDVVVDRSCNTCKKKHGPPRFTNAPWLSISVTHSFGQVGVAVAVGVRVGLDVERGDAKAEPVLVRRVCSDLEREQLAVGRPASASVDFVRLWCRKESLLKAYGVGLTVSPAAVDVSNPRPVLSGEASRRIDLGAHAGWLPIAGPGKGFVGALFATDLADLLAEVPNVQLSPPLWEPRYGALLKSLHPGR
jgi:4'-phosphopantetheinyl transferase